ncbi:MAG: hypothetical protein ACOYXM_00940 [Actinomycetota bacterium]
MPRQRKWAPPQRSPAWRARRYLLLPVVPILVIFALVLGVWLLSILPGPLGPVAGVVLLSSWVGALYHAGRQARPGWVVGVALFWPASVGYWIYIALRLDRDWQP